MTARHTLPTALALMLIVTCTNALADGCFLAPFIHEIYETDQIAFISHDAETDVEDLHILPRFYGDATEFAWVVPVPALPDLAESNTQLFWNCADATYPVYRYRDEAWGCSDGDVLTGAANGGRDDVVVLEQEIVGIYDTMIVSADNASALTDTLEAWGFLHDGNSEATEAVLADYVADGWFFVTLRIDASSYEGSSYGYWDGAIDPIRLTFASEEIIYPMRISALSAHHETDVVLYVAADVRTTFPGAETTYANRVTADELQAIRSRYATLGAELREGVFFTRLERTFAPTDMDADIVLTADEDSSEFRQIHYSGFPVMTGLLLATLAACKIGPWRRRNGAR